MKAKKTFAVMTIDELVAHIQALGREHETLRDKRKIARAALDVKIAERDKGTKAAIASLTQGAAQ